MNDRPENDPIDAELADLAAIYGTDPQRWPADDPRVAAALARLDRADPDHAEQARLDAALKGLAVPEPTAAFMARLMDVPDRHVRAARQPLPERRGSVRDHFLARWFSPLGLGAQAASFVAMALVGLWMGGLSGAVDGTGNEIDLTEMVWQDPTFDLDGEDG